MGKADSEELTIATGAGAVGRANDRSESGVMFSTFTPRLELGETDEAYVLRAELPGMTARDIELSIEGEVLTLRGERAHARSHGGERFQFSECAYGSFERSVQLPAGADPSRVEADFLHGLLEVRLAKRSG